MKDCYIVGAGDFFGIRKPTEGDLVIAADGGYKALISHGVRPDLLIGDFDSLRDMPKEIETLRFPVKKDDTDMLLAYREGVKRGFFRFLLYGGTGGRPDHTFANYSLLLLAREEGKLAMLVEEKYVSFVIKNESVLIRGRKNASFSVFAFGGEAAGVSVSGAKYSAKDITLSPSFPLGVSNSFSERDTEVSVRSGALLVMAEGISPNDVIFDISY